MMNTAGKCKPFFYGWVIVALPFTDLALVSGVCYSFSAFVLPFTREFGWTRAEISGAFALNTALYGFIGPPQAFFSTVLGRAGRWLPDFLWVRGWLAGFMT
jgi:hypothetical protein